MFAEMFKMDAYGMSDVKETTGNQSKIKCICPNCGCVFRINYMPIRKHLTPVYIRCPKCFNNVSIF